MQTIISRDSSHTDHYRGADVGLLAGQAKKILDYTNFLVCCYKFLSPLSPLFPLSPLSPHTPPLPNGIMAHGNPYKDDL